MHWVFCLLLAACSADAPQLSTPSAAPPPFSARDRIEHAPFVGEVVEVLSAGSYIYLRLQTKEAGDVWTVALWLDVQEGDRVEVRPFVERRDFVSKRTHRSFERLLFVTASLLNGGAS